MWPRQSRVQPVLESEEEYYDHEFPQLKPQTSKHREEQFGKEENVGSGLKQIVSFYFINVPELILYAYLRQGFEVCGILEDLYLAKKC